MSSSKILNRLFISSVILMPALIRLFYMRVVTNYHLDIFLFAVSFIFSVRDSRYIRYYFAGPMLIWGIWETYSLINWKIIGLRPNDIHTITFFWRLLQVYFLAVVIAYEGSKDLKGTIRWIIYTFLLYIFLGLTMQGNNSIEETGSWAERGGNILKNKLSLTACALTFTGFAALMSNYINKKFFYFLFVLSFFTILWVATRKAILVMFIYGIFYSLTQVDYHNSKNRSKIIGFALVLFVGYWYVMNYTQIGSRIAELDEYEFDVPVPTYLSFLGDRAIQYMLGFELFLDNPITGIGIFNFMEVAQFPYNLHTEYMTQLCEGGIIGTLLYICFNYKLIKNALITYKDNDRKMGLVFMSGIAFVLFVSLTTWTYDGAYYWVVFGLINAYCVRNNIIKI